MKLALIITGGFTAYCAIAIPLAVLLGKWLKRGCDQGGDDLTALADATREKRTVLPDDAEIERMMRAWGEQMRNQP